MFRSIRPAALGALALGLMLTACTDEDTSTTAPGLPGFNQSLDNRVFTQRERLANPLVSEVTVRKTRHGLYNFGAPATDVAQFSADVEGFITGVAGRDPAVANVISSVLLPDMLLVYPKRSPVSVGWLSWAFGGYGGRALRDDVVDIGLMAIFGGLLGIDLGHVTPGLTTDNVNTNDVAFGATFPYLAPSH
jgi:hypothetical protein